MKIYDKSGYLDMRAIIRSGYPFIFIAAARGTGKTYGALKYFIDTKKKIIQLRRTQKECDAQNTESGSSYKKVCSDLGVDFTITKSGGIGTVWIDDRPVCHNLALSTFSTVRGIDFSDIDYVFYDEFIAETHVRKIRGEGMALANFYESVNRNRELTGEKPLQLICAANSVNMANETFLYFDLIKDAEEMISADEEVRQIGNKLLIIPQHSPISEQKASTALYQAVNSEFSEMAIKNKFILNDQTYVKKRSLQEYRCIYQFGDIFVFEHKSEKYYYCTFQKGISKNVFRNGYADRKKAQRSCWKVVQHYLDGLVYFEDYRTLALFEKYFDID